MNISREQIGETSVQDKATEAAIVYALEMRREPVVPLDFAARVRSVLPELQPVRAQRTMGRTVALVAAGILLILLFAIAPHTTQTWTNVPMYVELLVLAQLGAIGYFVSLRKI